jgi:hypothetical protein
MTLLDSLQGRCATSLLFRICAVYGSPAAEPAQTETTFEVASLKPSAGGSDRSLMLSPAI